MSLHGALGTLLDWFHGGCLLVSWWLLGCCVVVAWWLRGGRVVVPWWFRVPNVLPTPQAGPQKGPSQARDRQLLVSWLFFLRF